MTDDDTEACDSRRAPVTNGALATGALVLGTGAGSGAVTPTDAQEGEALVFSANFYPEQAFTVTAQLEQGTTVDVLRIDGETVPEISQPDEWTGHVVQYDMDGETAGITTFLFLRGAALSAGDTATFAGGASMYSPDLNLLSTRFDAAEEEPIDEDPDELDDEPTDEEPSEGVNPCEVVPGDPDYCQ